MKRRTLKGAEILKKVQRERSKDWELEVRQEVGRSNSRGQSEV